MTGGGSVHGWPGWQIAAAFSWRRSSNDFDCDQANEALSLKGEGAEHTCRVSTRASRLDCSRLAMLRWMNPPSLTRTSHPSLSHEPGPPSASLRSPPRGSLLVSAVASRRMTKHRQRNGAARAQQLLPVGSGAPTRGQHYICMRMVRAACRPESDRDERTATATRALQARQAL